MRQCSNPTKDFETLYPEFKKDMKWRFEFSPQGMHMMKSLSKTEETHAEKPTMVTWIVQVYKTEVT